MLCAISGEAPQVPVLSTKSGCVYEKRLIESYISENGTEPTTGDTLTTEDLIDLKTSRIVRPRPPTLTSIPSLLGVFQEEWDALALETFTLKKNLAETRQELSTALYQHDAAVRVIARLTRERDEAREALSKVDIGARVAPANGDAMQIDNAGLPENIVTKIEATQERLSKTRRKRPVPEDWATTDEISTYKPTQTSEPLYPGGKVLSLDAINGLALVGGLDGTAGVYSIQQQRLLHPPKGGGGAITDAVWAGSRAAISTQQGRVKVFEGSNELATFSNHAGAINGLSLHPSGDILASVGTDKSYVLYDLKSMSTITQVYTDSTLTTTSFHPDGHLLAIGNTFGSILIYDLKSSALAATFSALGPPSISALSFSENGTWLASSSVDSTQISIWDLRKSTNIHVLDTGGAVEALSWDYSAQFLASGGPNGVTVQRYDKGAKEWSEPLRVAVPSTALAWGAQGKAIVTINTEGVLTTIEADA